MESRRHLLEDKISSQINYLALWYRTNNKQEVYGNIISIIWFVDSETFGKGCYVFMSLSVENCSEGKTVDVKFRLNLSSFR